MAEYIKREDAIELFWPVDPENDGSDGCTVGLKCGHYNSNEIEAMLSDLPAAEVVSRAVYEQTAWERDIAMEQLAAHGIGFGEECEAAAFARWKYCPNCGARMDKGADHEVSE